MVFDTSFQWPAFAAIRTITRSRQVRTTFSPPSSIRLRFLVGRSSSNMCARSSRKPLAVLVNEESIALFTIAARARARYIYFLSSPKCDRKNSAVQYCKSIISLYHRAIFDVGHRDIDRQRAGQHAMRDSSNHRTATAQAASQFARYGAHDSHTMHPVPASDNSSTSAACQRNSPSSCKCQQLALLFARTIYWSQRRTGRANLERDSRKKSFFQLPASFTEVAA